MMPTTGMKNSVAQDILQRSIDHILSAQGRNGAWSRLQNEFPFEAEPTSWAVTVLSSRKTAIDTVQKGVDFIIGDQQADGSWNRNAAHTGFALIALKNKEGTVEAVKKAIAYLISVQHQNGGFQRTAGVGECTSLHTSIVLFALEGLSPNENIVKRSLEWLGRCQNQDGGYGVSVGESSVAFATARCIKAFRIHGVSLADCRIQAGISWLLQMQKASGGFSMTALHPEDPELTAYAITALTGIQGYGEQIDKAVGYLAGIQETDGSFVSYAPIQFNGVTKKNTQTTCFVAWALLEMLGEAGKS